MPVYNVKAIEGFDMDGNKIDFNFYEEKSKNLSNGDELSLALVSKSVLLQNLHEIRMDILNPNTNEVT